MGPCKKKAPSRSTAWRLFLLHMGQRDGGRAGVWLGMQAAYGLWHARKSAEATLNKIKPSSSRR
jgi:hypothetical protein